MTRRSALMTGALSLLTACTVVDGGYAEDPCTDACFDQRVVDVAPPDDAAPDATPDLTPGADAAPQTLDAAPDVTLEEPDGAREPLDAGHADAAPADAAAVDAAPPAPVESCDAIGAVECFGHPDCPDDQRCYNVGTVDAPVACCVPGARGDLAPGASCADVDGQIECQSGVCIEDVGGDDVCSGTCQGPADCPPALPRCVAFPFGGTDFMWCFPP